MLAGRILLPQFSLAAPSSDEQSPSVDVPGPPPDKVKDIRDHQHGVVQTVERQEEEQPPSRFHSPAGFLPGLLAGFLFASALTVTRYFVVPTIFEHHARGPVMQLWGPLLAKPDRVLISAGRTHVEETDTPEPPNATIEQHILRPEARLSFSAVQAIHKWPACCKHSTSSSAFMKHIQTICRIFTGSRLYLSPDTTTSGRCVCFSSSVFTSIRLEALHYIVDAEHPERRTGASTSTPHICSRRRTMRLSDVSTMLRPRVDLSRWSRGSAPTFSSSRRLHSLPGRPGIPRSIGAAPHSRCQF